LRFFLDIDEVRIRYAARDPRCPSGAGKTRSRRAEAGAQPTYLSAVVDLVLGDMEPGKVGIHCEGDDARPLSVRRQV
jgi:hypothetical protein